MSYTMDKNLEEGLNLLAEGKKIDTALKLINKSARKGKTKGKSFFEVGRIVREGIPGMEGNPEDARKYYDSAMSHFAKLDVNALDCLDYREMGDYYNYALGTEEADKAKAVDYYKKAVELGDEVAKERLEQVEKELSSGSATTAPSLAAPSTTPAATPAVKEAATKTVVEEKEETYPVVEHEPIPEEKKTIAVAPSPVADVQPEPTVVTEVKEAAPVAAPAPAVEEKPVEEKPAVEEAPNVEKAKEVVPEGKTYASDSAKVQHVIEGDQILIRAIRLIDSPVSTEKEVADGVELLKTAVEEGSMRAAVLLAYLYEGKSSFVSPNFELAKQNYEVAIGRGSSVAEYRLGLLYLSEDTYFYNEALGHEHIVKAARAGYAPALNYIGDAYRSKVTNPKNLEIAYRYYSLAGERGYGLAYHNMAEIDASRQEIALSREHEKYAILNGYDPDTCKQDPLTSSLHL